MARELVPEGYDGLLHHSDNIRLLGARLRWHSFTR
jgi:hypothetical protein